MSGSSKKVIYAALAGNFLIAVTKFFAALFTGSSAMFSEGIHSLVDTGNQGLLLYGMRQGRRPASPRFPFGHGKEVYFWSFVVAILIFAVGSGVSVFQGIQHLITPQPIENPMVNYIVLALAMVFEGSSWLFALTEFSRAKGKWGYVEAIQRGKDPTLFMVVFEDSAAMLGLIVALLGVFLAEHTGLLWLDGAASVLIGVILGGTAVWLAWETKGLLIGEAANTPVVNGIRRLAEETPEIDQVNELLTMHMGPDYVLVTISVAFSPHIEAVDLERIIADLDARIKATYPQARKIFVEAESIRVPPATSGQDTASPVPDAPG